MPWGLCLMGVALAGNPPAFHVSKGGMGLHHHLYRLSALLASLLGRFQGLQLEVLMCSSRGGKEKVGSFSDVTFLCNPNVVGQFALFDREGGGTSSPSLKSMSSGIDSSPEESYKSSAGVFFPFDGAWVICSSCEGFGTGVCLGARYGASMSPSSSVSWPFSLSSSALTYLGGVG